MGPIMMCEFIVDCTTLVHCQSVGACKGYYVLSAGVRQQALLMRAKSLILHWQEKYAEHQPDWLPPAGAVRLLEDIDATIGK